MKVFSLILVLFSLQVFGQSQPPLTSPFKSRIVGLDIPNSGVVTPASEHHGAIIRSQAPRENWESTEYPDYDQLKSYGVTDVLVFKNQRSNEVDTEIARLNELGIASDNIEFVWKNHPSFKSACLETIEALQYLKKVYLDPKRKILFHCTVGEDRTGYLAGLWQILIQNWSVKDAFKDEMCQNGYEAGNPDKLKGKTKLKSGETVSVAEAIRRSLTTIYLKMAYKIERGYLTLDNLDEALTAKDEYNRTECDKDPAKKMKKDADYLQSDFVCTKSPLYPNH